ncbi:BTB/POZ domain-containing protein 6-B [Lepeophtheirus salmonis]|uniref:BTB/POZ domain-containing protein 6-B n=1 Tax=Lepeophtheirus salmonis TaxID=72036 RepID=UPI001AEABC36|nr:BTB/POZ domain-containing protein 6-B-like isoform X1 [Lepeophtheirus salmonis]XP_040579585.1 BTB/POZ domain-containing protein 6-B-like isoform X1 [Lepeophtheirus salmonis]XP_040579586.1 BTB/POZ domain-containing protein 6-B-like isoform X1 [Lepeophtheirus salmonis]
MEYDWKLSKKTLVERNSALYNNPLMSDVTFIVGREGKEIIHAHKYVLSIGSPVFQVMFYGHFAKVQKSSDNPITIIDIEPQSFFTLLKYLYSDVIELHMDHIVSILYASKKYMIQHLTEQCVLFINKNLTPNNVCALLSNLRIYEDISNTISLCWDLIDSESQLAISSESFIEVDHSILTQIIFREGLNCTELEVFKAALNWANARLDPKEVKNEQDKNNLGKKRREILGSALDEIRFPLMTIKEFADEVIPTGILNHDEIIDIFVHLSSPKIKPEIRYCSNRRKGRSKTE